MKFRVIRLIGVLALYTSSIAPGVMAQTNPYQTIDDWATLPEGRDWGSTSAIYPAVDGDHMWVAERCGQNSCVGRDQVDPILLFDSAGKLVRSFGAGLIVWPHGIYVDAAGNVWIADARGDSGRGHQVHKFSPEGKLIMSLGVAGTPGSDNESFDQPSDVLVAPNGDVFVADGHGAEGNNRIVKFNSRGKFIMTWGGTGAEAGEFRDPHALAMDSRGRLFVGDRGNSRLQIFTPDGKHLSTWTSFGRPSGLFIDNNDVLYSADSESNATWGSNPGWLRGIRIGSATSGFVTRFIPDPEQDPDHAGTTAAEGVAVDRHGHIYGAEVGPQRVRKYVLRQWDLPQENN